MQPYVLSQLSLINASKISVPEVKIPLWASDGVSVNTSGGSASGSVIGDGSTSCVVSTSTNTNIHLHTLNANWNPNLKFALEVSLSVSSASYIAYSSLWDFTSSVQVSGSQVSTTSTTYSVIRSGQFSLTPGHILGVSLWNSSSGTSYLTDASLVVFLS